MTLDVLETRKKLLTKKIKLWLLITIVWLVILAIVSTYLWEHIIVEIASVIPLIVVIYYSWNRYKVEESIYKLKPKNDFPLVQRDEKTYKKALTWVKSFQLIGMVFLIMLFINIIVRALKLTYVELGYMEDVLIILIGINLVWLIWIEVQLQMSRKQYLKYYVTYNTADIIKEENKDE